MSYFDPQLKRLLLDARQTGRLTFDQINDYLPDEDTSSDRLHQLLVAVEELGIDIVEQSGPKSAR